MNFCLKKNCSDKFVLFTVLISFLIACLYVWKGIKTEFTLLAYIIIGMNILYIPFAILFSRNGFPFFYIIYSAFLIFSDAIHDHHLVQTDQTSVSLKMG